MSRCCRLIRAFNCFALAMSIASGANADECGSSPDYVAHRSFLADGQSGQSREYKVFFAGSSIREEQDVNNGDELITLRLLGQGITYVFSAIHQKGYEIKRPELPPPTSMRRRTNVEKQANGSTIHHNQLYSDGEWRDVSTTVCRSDNVMISQSFIMIDRDQNVIRGTITQTDVELQHLSSKLFELPTSVKIGPDRAPAK